MSQKIAAQKKDFAMLQEKYKKINIVNDQVSGWAKRVYQKFSALTDDASVQNLPTDMVKIFASMEMITVTELKNIRENADQNRVEPDDAFVDLDFATEDFINKNIRVRPISGISKMDEKSEKRTQIGSQNQEDNEEHQDNQYNKLAIYEIENQRKETKRLKAEYLAEQLRKQALEEKKAQKK